MFVAHVFIAFNNDVHDYKSGYDDDKSNSECVLGNAGEA
jgi:hypothetical protein